MRAKISADYSEENVLSSNNPLLSILRQWGKENIRMFQKMYLDSADLKKFLNVSDSTLYRLRKEKIIPTIKIGRKKYCPVAFFVNLLTKGDEEWLREPQPPEW